MFPEIQTLLASGSSTEPTTREDSSSLNTSIHSHLEWSSSQKQSILKGELT